MKKSVVIVGGGVSGLTCAIYCARFGYNVTVFNDCSYGSLSESPSVENFPGFINISGLDLLMQMEEQAKHFGADILPNKIESIDKKNNKVYDDNNDYLKYDALVIATGMTHSKLDILENVSDSIKKHIHYCATCDGEAYKNKKVAVIGGGDSALTEAIYLSNICKQVTIIHRRNQFRASQTLIDKIGKIDNIKTELECEITCTFGINDNLYAIELNHNYSIQVDGIFVCVGQKSNDELFKNFRKNKENIFFCGDCVENKYRQAVIAAGDGAKTAIDVNDYLINH